MLKRYFTQHNLFFVILIIAAGIFVRVYGISYSYYFSGELGKELLYIKQFADVHRLPLVGMATSHSWLYYGPLYYWIMIPIFIVFNGDPYILFWTSLFVSIVGLALNYIVVNKIADQKIALISTLIQSLSPLLVWQTRLSKLHVFFWILMPIFTYLLYLMWNKNKKFVFIAGVIFGILFSFHFSQIPILGVVALLFWIKKDFYKPIDWLKFGIGSLIPNLTLLWQDRSLALWLPYRIVSSVDKDPGNTLYSLTEYFGRNIFWNSNYWFIGLILFVILICHYVYRNKNKLKQDFLPFYLITSIGLMLFANIIHGAPPVHYFLPIFTTVPILLSIYLAKFKYSYLLIAILVLVNLPGYFKLNSGDDYVPFSKQIAMVNFIIHDADGQPFSIKRIGPYDYFPEQYSQNYKYLLLWRGGKLIEEPSSIYIINDANGTITK